MPKVKPSLRVESEIDAMLVKGHIKQLYFEQMRVYRTMFQSTETSMTWRIVDRETSNNYILRANGVAAGKFNISHISL